MHVVIIIFVLPISFSFKGRIGNDGEMRRDDKFVPAKRFEELLCVPREGSDRVCEGDSSLRLRFVRDRQGCLHWVVRLCVWRQKTQLMST